MRTLTERFLARFFVVALSLSFVPAGAMLVIAQDRPAANQVQLRPDEKPAREAQVVALDECDPTTFNAALGPGFCKNVTLATFGYATTLSDLLKGAEAGHPNPNWDFEPDTVHIKRGTNLSVVDQGGEPHTFTEVEHFGGGFIKQLNGPGEETVPECAGGYSKVAVARTRIIQGSQIEVTDLSKGEHKFQCCIHPWMRVTVDVK
jgi:plastocyanin